VSQIHNKKNKYGNNNKRFVYMNKIKFIKKWYKRCTYTL
jgi:hypothetical protein